MSLTRGKTVSPEKNRGIEVESSDQLVNELQKLLLERRRANPPAKGKLEVEVRYQINPAIWTRFKTQLDTETHPQARQELQSTVKGFMSGIRSITGLVNGNHITVWEKKTELVYYKSYDYSYKTVISLEEPSNPIQSALNFIRFRIRYRYEFDQYYLDLTKVDEQIFDPKIPIKQQVHGKATTRYEIELELKPEAFKTKARALDELTLRIRRKILDTFLDYTQAQLNNIQKISEALLKPTGDAEEHNGIVNAVPINKNNITQYNFNDFMAAPKADGVRKVLLVYQGEVWLLYGKDEANWLGQINDDKTYVILGELCYPKREISLSELQTQIELRMQQINKPISPRSSPRTAASPGEKVCVRLFVPDDVLYYETDLRLKNYPERLDKVYPKNLRHTSYEDYMYTELLEIKRNPVYSALNVLLALGGILLHHKPIRSIDDFTTVNRELWTGVYKTPSLESYGPNIVQSYIKVREVGVEYPYNIDGIVYTYKGPYNPKKSEVTVNPVLKWKPPELTSIDFLIRLAGQQIIPVYQKGTLIKASVHGEKPKVEYKQFPFLGSDKFKFSNVTLFPENERKDPTIVYSFLPGYYKGSDSSQSLIRNSQSEQNKPRELNRCAPTLSFTPNVREYLIRNRPDLLNQDFIYLYYERSRPDKRNPNGWNVVKNNWDAINEPLTIDAMIGDSVELMFSYHKLIKSEYLPKLVKDKVVLDIGFGQGGDIGRYKGAKRVYGIEPNPDFLNKARARIKQRQDPTKSNQSGPEFILAELSGTDYEGIKAFVKEPVDLVVMMLSATFFWQDHLVFENLVKGIKGVLKPDGKLVIFTLDGLKVARLFNDYYTSNELLAPQVPVQKRETKAKLPPELPSATVPLALGEVPNPGEPGANPSLQEALDLEPEGNPEAIARLSFPPAYIDLMSPLKDTQVKFGKRILIYLPGSRTVEGPQEEYLVNLNDLEPVGFKTVESHDLEGSQILSNTHNELARLYTWRVFALGKAEEKEKVKTPHKASSQTELSMLRKGVEQLKLDWTQEPVYRVNTIGEGSCFIHAFLNAFYPEYHLSDNDKARKIIAKEFRQEMAEQITAENPNYPGFSYWETSGNGFFLNYYLLEKYGQGLAEALPFRTSLPALRKLFASTDYLGQEAIHYLSDLTNLAIIVVGGYECPKNKKVDCNQLSYVDTSLIQNDSRKIVIIVQVHNHYELIGVLRNNQLQTVFVLNDPFVQNLLYRINLSPFRPEPVRDVFETLSGLLDVDLGFELSKLQGNNPARIAYEKVFNML